jgi:hypothetical protein
MKQVARAILLALSALSGCVSMYHQYEDSTLRGDNLVHLREAMSGEKCPVARIFGERYRLAWKNPVHVHGRGKCTGVTRHDNIYDWGAVVSGNNFDLNKLGVPGTSFDVYLIKGAIPPVQDNYAFKHVYQNTWKPEYLLEQRAITLEGKAWDYQSAKNHWGNFEAYSRDLGDGYHLTAGAWYFPPVNQDEDWFSERRALFREMVESIRVERLQ